MDKYKVNLVYKDGGLNLNDIIIKTLISELKIIYYNDLSDTHSSLEKGDKN